MPAFPIAVSKAGNGTTSAPPFNLKTAFEILRMGQNRAFCGL
jgi:hypothetical protein